MKPDSLTHPHHPCKRALNESAYSNPKNDDKYEIIKPDSLDTIACRHGQNESVNQAIHKKVIDYLK